MIYLLKLKIPFIVPVSLSLKLGKVLCVSQFHFSWKIIRNSYVCSFQVLHKGANVLLVLIVTKSGYNQSRSAWQSLVWFRSRILGTLSKRMASTSCNGVCNVLMRRPVLTTSSVKGWTSTYKVPEQATWVQYLTIIRRSIEVAIAVDIYRAAERRRRYEH